MKFTRREILTAFLGAPFALAACRTAEPRFAQIEGEIVGANVDLGHRLRANNFGEIAAGNWETKKVVIVGGGAAGLTAAWQLNKNGLTDFALLELEQNAGGTAQSGASSNFQFPWGAHYLPAPTAENRELIALLDEMNLLEGKTDAGEPIFAEQFLCREPENRIFYEGRWFEGTYLNFGADAEDLRQLELFQKELNFWIAWRDGDGKRAFRIPVESCSKDAFAVALDKISFADWLADKKFTSPRLLKFCDYACRDDYGLRPEQTSAWAGLFYFCSRVPEIGKESQPFLTFPEGNGKFVKHLHEKSRANIRLNQAVYQIVPNERGVEVLIFDAATNQTRGIRADKVIFAAPMFLAQHLIRDFPFDWAREFEHNAWFVANLFLKDRPQQNSENDFPLAWDNVLYESPSLGYVNSTHQRGIDHGATVLTYYFPMCETGNESENRNRLFAMNWQECADLVLSDLERAHRDIRNLTTKIDVMRWGHAMISPRPNFMFGGARERAVAPFRNIHFAHSDLSGMALFEEAFFQGSRAAKFLLT